MSYSYARAEGLAAEFERAAESKARLKLAARSMANDAGMGPADPRLSGGREITAERMRSLGGKMAVPMLTGPRVKHQSTPVRQTGRHFTPNLNCYR